MLDRVRPQEWNEDGPNGADSGPWLVGEDEWEENPRRALTADDQLAVSSFLWSRDAYGGTSCLPHAGGILDQCAVLMDAWQTIEPAYHEFRPKD